MDHTLTETSVVADGQVTLLHALTELLAAISDHAKRSEEEFFKRIAEHLHRLCERIAYEAGAESAAVFFVAGQMAPDGKRYMVMRGASGRLRCTFAACESRWREWTKTNSLQAPILPGFAYPEEAAPGGAGASVTNQIWRLGEGRIANSNRAMDQLHGGQARTGSGDLVAYPGKSLHETFRTMIAVPIFAQGEGRETSGADTDERPASFYPPSASATAEFFRKYSVIGILKVEGKKPLYNESPREEVVMPALERLFRRPEIRQLELVASQRESLRRWCRRICDGASWEAAFAKSFPDFMRVSHARSTDAGRFDRARRIRKEIADMVTACCQGVFNRQDMELLVLLAMQVGRLTTRRIIKYAADNDIILTENEVGALSIRWEDIRHLVALQHAAEAARSAVLHHLKALKAELDFQRRQDVFRARVSEMLDPHGPIREVTARRKTFISLTRKLLRKQRRLEESASGREVSVQKLQWTMENSGIRYGEQSIVRGPATLFVRRPDSGEGAATVQARLGTVSGPHITIRSDPLPLHDPQSQGEAPSLRIEMCRPLVQRILDDNFYRVDDLAGARIITDYDSDIDDVLDELRVRVPQWGLEFVKVDDMRDGKEGGYRAVHVTLRCDVSHLLHSQYSAPLRKAMGQKGRAPIWMPVEIQLKTAYQYSWALKTHGSSYKREAQISQELRDEQEILANVLAEADWLSDIVRSGIQHLLLPPDYGERRLLEHLRRMVTREDMQVIKFGIACAKEMLRQRLRYNGQPEYSLALEVCERLVYSFGVLDSRMLLLALLRNAWRAERSQGPRLVDGSTPAASVDETREGIIELLCDKLERQCPTALAHYRWRLPIPNRETHRWLRDWLASFPGWFKDTQCSFREYFRQPPDDPARQWKERLQHIYSGLLRGASPKELEHWLERAYLLEAAILLANLVDLPVEPGRVRRKRLHNDYLSLFREIRRYLPAGDVKSRIVEELDLAFREIETALDLPREPEWWGE